MDASQQEECAEVEENHPGYDHDGGVDDGDGGVDDGDVDSGVDDHNGDGGVDDVGVYVVVDIRMILKKRRKQKRGGRQKRYI